MRRNPEEAFIFFPLINLDVSYKLKYGHIGPVSILSKKYSRLSKIIPALDNVLVNGEKIKDPVFAVSTLDFRKFIYELECIAFLAKDNPAIDEIFFNKVLFTIHKNNKDKTDLIRLNKYALFPLDLIDKVFFRDFPKEYQRWETKYALKFKDELPAILNSTLYRGLICCLADDEDDELRKEKQRIVISILLYNKAFINLTAMEPFSNTKIILIAAAFEALLNLPSEAIRSSFEQIITTMIGKKTSMLKAWCKDFYKYRSNLVHGDVDWDREEKSFMYRNKKGPFHIIIARDIFYHCLKTKLYLMGIYKGDEIGSFDFDRYINL
jgi:hypothetical protein